MPEDWKKANIPLIFKKGKKEDPGSYRLVKLTLISMAQKNHGNHIYTYKEGDGNSWHHFMPDKPNCLLQ